jgi:microcystin degradation protein MlrC
MKDRTLRLGFARIMQETNCLSPVETTMEDFRLAWLMEGAELMRACEKDGVEAKGFLKNAELSGFVKGARESGAVELVPLVSAWAVPSGPLTPETYEALKAQLLESVRAAMPLDGIYLCLHGAMGVRGMRDPEADLIESVRALAPDAKIAASFDLHASLTQRKIAPLDIAIAYATNPHRDHASTGRKCARLLARALRGEVQPAIAWRSLPMLIGGGVTVDFLPPMRSIFAELRRLERKGELLSASVVMCHPWNDDPDLGWSVVTIADGDRERAEAIAERIAERCWSVREKMPPTFVSASDAIAAAKSARVRRKLGVVTMSDTSDAVGAGGPGDNTRLLRALMDEAGDLVSYVPLRDPRAIEALWSEPIGAEVALEVGGTLDPEIGEPLRVRGRLVHKREDAGFKRRALLAIGAVRLAITEGPALALKPSFYTDLGLSIWSADIVVVKSFFPFLLYMAPYNRKTLFVRTKGRTDVDAAYGLSFADAMHPMQHVGDWRDADRRRRGAT